jgi:PE family
MSFVNASPEYVAAAASDLANIGSAISSANSAALGPTSSVPAAGADVVSASIAALFDGHAQAYQALSAQAALFHQQFVQLMSGGATQYAGAEAANASPLQTAQQGVLSGAPSQALTSGSSLIGSAAPAGSVAAGVPAATAGLAGGSAPAASAGHLAPVVSPASAASAALAPASTPAAAVQAAAPAGSAALAPASTPVAATQAETPAYSPATAETAVPASASAPVAAAAAETPEFSPATALPAAVPTPASTAAAAAPAYSPATPPYSPATAGPAGSPESQTGSLNYIGRHRVVMPS